jgi:hypothetical protein
MIRRALWLAPLLLVACGRSAPPDASPAATTLAPARASLGVNVSVRTSDDIVALDATGNVRYRAPHALMTPSRRVLISTTDHQETTVVQTIDPTDGHVLFAQKLEGEFVPVALSTGGERAALAPANYDPPASGEIAVGRSSTTIMVVNTDASRPPQAITLTGNFVPEGFTSENTALAAIEFLPAEHPVKYRVRVISLTEPGTLLPPFGWLTKEPLDMTMVGVRGSHVLTDDGRFLYTLYRDRDGTAFVHSLGLDIGRQYCVGLPSDLDLANTTGALGAAPDGAHLYLVTAAGKLAEITTGVTSGKNPEVTRIVGLGVTGDGSPPAVTVTASTLYASFGKQLVAVDLASLESTRTPLPAPASALAVASSAGTVYASALDRIFAVGPEPAPALTLPAGVGAVSELYLD